MSNVKAERIKARQNILSEKSDFSVIEAYKAARTNLIFTLEKDTNNKAVVFTSVLPGDGKTTSCINLAVTFAQTGSNVLVIDGDMRRPSIHRYLGTPASPGLSDRLGGFSDYEECLYPTRYKGLFVMPAGVIPPNPSELVLSDEMDRTLAFLSEKFDYIFMDAPPVGLVTDAAILGTKTLGVVFVVKQGATSKGAIAEQLKVLEHNQAKLLGFLLNEAVDERAKSRYDGAKYGYY